MIYVDVAFNIISSTATLIFHVVVIAACIKYLCVK